MRILNALRTMLTCAYCRTPRHGRSEPCAQRQQQECHGTSSLSLSLVILTHSPTTDIRNESCECPSYDVDVRILQNSSARPTRALRAASTTGYVARFTSSCRNGLRDTSSAASFDLLRGLHSEVALAPACVHAHSSCDPTTDPDATDANDPLECDANEPPCSDSNDRLPDAGGRPDEEA